MQHKDEMFRLSAANREDEREFKETMRQFAKTDTRERTQFSSVLSQGESIFQHQQLLAESLTEKLLPGDGPTPVNACGTINFHKDDLLILVGEQAFVTNKFPHTIFQINDSPMLQIDRTKSGAIQVIADIRGQDGRIIARLGRNGIIVNEANKLEVTKGSHRIVIEDQFGNDVLNIQYVNRHVLRVNALLFYKGFPIRLSNPVDPNSNSIEIGCAKYAGADIYWRLRNNAR